jgi:FkbM family methyltransferase
MPTSSSLTEQLATLGIHLPAWPKEPEGGNASGDWIQEGQAFAEGVRLWRAQLRNASERTKNVVDLLLQHQQSTDQLTPWDKWLSAVIHHEVKENVTLDYWRLAIALLQQAPLTRSQILGGLLTMADSQQLAGAANGALRLMKANSMSSKEILEVCALLSSRSDATWRLAEADSCPKMHQGLVDLHLEYCRLLAAALEQNTGKATNSEYTGDESIVASLERILVILGEDDQWCGIPKARANEILSQSGLEATLNFLAQNAPGAGSHKGRASLLAAQMLAEQGKWEEVKNLNQESLERLKAYQQAGSAQASELEVIRAETDLLTHELSIALGNGSLDQSIHLRSEGTQHWQSLSRSQLGQDLWVLEQLAWKREGFFVEFGATDGVLLSNSWLLEKHFGWSGICAEPNPKFFKRLQQNRSCSLSSACVYRSSGERMRFVLADAYGGLEELARGDQHVEKRNAYAAVGNLIEVTTISLIDMLDQQDAPEVIDYLSIDTEGSELAILEGIDWRRYQFRCITVEHNFTKQRQDIQKLLEAQGYRRFEQQWDDWYVKAL